MTRRNAWVWMIVFAVWLAGCGGSSIVTSDTTSLGSSSSSNGSTPSQTPVAERHATGGVPIDPVPAPTAPAPHVVHNAPGIINHAHDDCHPPVNPPNSFPTPAPFVTPTAVTTATGLPESAMPPVQDQGQLESCGTFGLLYEMVSYSAGCKMASDGKLKLERNLNDYANVVSPGWAWRNITTLFPSVPCAEGSGTTQSQCLNPAVRTGFATYRDVGYPSPAPFAEHFGSDKIAENQCEGTPGPFQPTPIDSIQLDKYPPTSRLQIGSWYTLTPACDIDLIKEWIDYGHVVGIAINIYENFYDGPGLGIFEPGGTYQGGHWICAYAYDDKIQAFYVQNSWGTSWGNGGRFLMGYEAWKKIVTPALVALPVDDNRAVESSGGALAATKISGSGAIAPRGDVVKVHQAEQDGRVYLVLWYQFREPVDLEEFKLTAADGWTVTEQGNGRPIRNGFLTFTRQDGKEFPAGRHQVSFRVKQQDGTKWSYVGTVDLNRVTTKSLTSSAPPAGTTDSQGNPAL